jgi:F0F1-type ATP synthase membrane subunit b/b'
VAFIGFCWAIHKLGLWNYMVTTMADREKAAWAKLDAADAMLTQAEAGLRKFRGQFEALDDTVRATLAEGERDVTYTRSEIVRVAGQEAEKSGVRATHEIERARDQALHAIFESLADQVVGATEAALKQRIDTGAQDRLIETTLNRLAP